MNKQPQPESSDQPPSSASAANFAQEPRHNHNKQQGQHPNNQKSPNSQHKQRSTTKLGENGPNDNKSATTTNQHSHNTGQQRTKGVVTAASTSRDSTQVSKFMSLVLRHKPEAAQLTLDQHGWASTTELLRAINRKYPHPLAQPFTIEDMKSIVANCAKQRFHMSADGTQIRANQGHSLNNVDLELKPITIDDNLQLYHGTTGSVLDSIAKTGLTKQSRQYVHLSSNRETAVSVGRRHGQPIVLVVDMEQLKRDGLHVYCSENGVYLMDALPAKYLKLEDGTSLVPTPAAQ